MNPDDVVLVALMNSPRDLVNAVEEHWYRIPMRHAPKYFDGAQYLAFYLPAVFGERKWRIDTYAEVRGHELTTRRDLLPDEPEHPRADELYYKLQLGDVLQREPAILSKRGRRVLFLWTNWDKFSSAREWNDLYLRTPAHDALWSTLTAEALDVERETFVREGHTRYRVDFLIYLGKARVAVSIGEQHAVEAIGGHDVALTVTPAEIENHMGRVRREILQAAREAQQSFPERNTA